MKMPLFLTSFRVFAVTILWVFLLFMLAFNMLGILELAGMRNTPASFLSIGVGIIAGYFTWPYYKWALKKVEEIRNRFLGIHFEP